MKHRGFVGETSSTPLFVAAALLFGAPLRWGPGYYIILRYVVIFASIYGFANASDGPHRWRRWLFVLIATPFLILTLDRTTWLLVDVVAFYALLALAMVQVWANWEAERE